VHTNTFQTSKPASKDKHERGRERGRQPERERDGGSSSNQPELPSRIQPKKCIQIYILILIAKTPVIITLVYQTKRYERGTLKADS